MDVRAARRCGLYGSAAIVIGALFGGAGWQPFERVPPRPSESEVRDSYGRFDARAVTHCGWLAAQRQGRLAASTHRKTADELAIGKAIDSQRHELGLCYAVGLNRLANEDDRVTLRLDVTPEGAVSKAAVVVSNAQSTAVDSCLARTGRRLRFAPRAGGEAVSVTYPISFKQVPFNFTAATR